jgi:transcriptional regulator GlxA family with amidase domain
MNYSMRAYNTILKKILHLTLLLLVSFSTLVIAQAPKELFVCSPCGRDCDKLVFDKSGICPHCNMALVKQTQNPKEKKSEQVAILLFDGVQIIDFTGPFEVLGQSGYEVITVATNPSISTNMGLRVNPDFTFENCPKAGIFIIPGGNISVTRQSPEVIQWIKAYSEKSDLVMSVCNGALILAQTGLLDGLTATTYHNAIPEFENGFPKTKVISDQRFVDNGKYITTAGLSSGIDGALHLVERLKGKYKAQTVALNLEYDWKPDDNYARASLADKYLNKIFEGDDEGHPSISSVKLLNTEGNRDKWKVEFELTSTTTAEEIEKVLEKMISKKVDWKKEKNTLPTNCNWRFTSPEKVNWIGFLEVKQVSSSANSFLVSIRIDKSGVN